MERRIPKVISMGIKGGTGKTEATINIAYSLKEAGIGVGTADIDVDSPNLPKMVGLVDPDGNVEPMGQTSPERLWIPRDWKGLKIVSTGLMFDRQVAFSKFGDDNRTIVRSLLDKTAWPEDIELLVLDCPAGSSDEYKAVVEAEDSEDILGAVLVTLPNTVDDARRCIELCIARGVYILGIIENMRGFHTSCCRAGIVCAKCGRETEIFMQNEVENGPVVELAKEYDIAYYGPIPYVEGLNANGPILPEGAGGAILGAVVDILERLVAWKAKLEVDA